MSNDISQNEAIQIAMKFCGYRERSKKEVEDKLKSKNFNLDTIRNCINRLMELDFLNNIRFPNHFLEEKIKIIGGVKIKLNFILKIKA